MIEELKVLLDMLGNVDNIALYILGGFAVYKLVIYLSGVGAAVMLTKLAINKLHDYKTQPKKIDVSGMVYNEEDWTKIIGAISQYSTATYGGSLHGSDVRQLIKVLNEGEKPDV